MKQLIKISLAIFLALGLASCTSHISTKNSLITTVYITNQSEVRNSYIEVVKNMDRYFIKKATNNRVVVKYDPVNPIMGSATVNADFRITSGLTSDGRKATGVEIIYTDATSFFSQDSAFSGNDIIDRVKTALNEYMDYKNIKYYRIKK